MTIKVDEGHFQRLINSVEPREGVFGLDRLWSTHSSVSEPRFGLSEPEFFVHLCLLYLGDVCSGGHSQYFMNSSGRYALETLQALRTIGLESLAKILDETIKVIPEEAILKDDKRRNEHIASLSDEILDRWDVLDRAAYSESETYWVGLLKYLRAHQSEILISERAD